MLYNDIYFDKDNYILKKHSYSNLTKCQQISKTLLMAEPIWLTGTFPCCAHGTQTTPPPYFFFFFSFFLLILAPVGDLTLRGHNKTSFLNLRG